MAKFSTMIPAAQFNPNPVRKFDNSKPQPNAITVENPGVPEPAVILGWSEMIYERNTGTAQKTNYVYVGKNVEKLPTDRRSKKLILRFDNILNLEGKPFERQKQFTLSFAPNANLTALVSVLTGIPKTDEAALKEVDDEDLVGRNVFVILENKMVGDKMMAVIDKIFAAPKNATPKQIADAAAAAKATSNSSDENVGDDAADDYLAQNGAHA